MRKYLFVVALSVFVAFSWGCCPHVSMVDVPPLKPQHPIAVFDVAHRGNLHQGLPDNSLPAIRQATMMGISFLEVDVRRARNGALFLFHDSRLTASNSYAPRRLRGRHVQDLTTDERASVYLDQEQTTMIPTLREALLSVKGTKSSLQLDLKGESDSMLEEVLQIVKDTESASNAVVQIRDGERIKLARRLIPSIRIVARCRTESQLQEAVALGVTVVELERWVSEEAIEYAHTHGVLVSLNVASSRLDNESTKAYFRSRGIDSLMSDYAKNISY
jgi:glycerophosphoryl diester phosphodiesterase